MAAPLPLRNLSAGARPAAYLAALAAIFGGALAVGSAVGDDGDGSRPADHAAAGVGMSAMTDGGHGEHGAAQSEAPAAHGLGITGNGLRLVAPATARAGVRGHEGHVHTAALTQEVATA